DHAGDRGLALAGRRVARVGAEVDRDRRDRLLVGVVLVVGGGELLLGGGVEVLLVAVDAALAQRVVALGDDVDLEVEAGDLGPDARRRLLVLVGLGLVVGVGGLGGRPLRGSL